MQINILRRVDWVIAIALGAVIVGGGLAWYWFRPDPWAGWQEYSDAGNKIVFMVPSDWAVNSSPGYVRMESDPQKRSEIKILMKTDQMDSMLPALGLDSENAVKLETEGGIWSASHLSIEIPGDNVSPTSTVYYSFYHHRFGERNMILEITPSQKDSPHPDLERLISTIRELP